MTEEKYRLLPQDLAGYFYLADLPHSEECRIISDLFDSHGEWLGGCDRLRFKRSTADLLNVYETDSRTYSEAEFIMNEAGLSGLTKEEDADYFGAYFKLIRLQLMYSDIPYRKIKLRNLMRDFGYKRRSKAFTDNIMSALRALGLTPYLRGYESCHIAYAEPDEMIMIRITEDI